MIDSIVAGETSSENAFCVDDFTSAATLLDINCFSLGLNLPRDLCKYAYQVRIQFAIHEPFQFFFVHKWRSALFNRFWQFGQSPGV